ncbi:hypothetical protein C0991_005220 [Blastosporella zonata]|nr:hypothetical protein C0991_005220 [Blastosporella zonata]
MLLVSAPFLLSSLYSARAVTIYGQIPFGQTSGLSGTATAATAVDTIAPKSSAYDNTILTPPALPQDQPLTFTLDLPLSNTTVRDLSIMQHGSFFGFSIEMSVVTQLSMSTFLVPLLELIFDFSSGKERLRPPLLTRSDGVKIRIGGNTQDFTVYVDEIPDGHATFKEKSDLKKTRIPFNDTNWRLQIAEHSQAILGDNLLGLQAGNEPDYYLNHGHRTEPYGPPEYFKEFSNLIAAVQNNPSIPIKNMLIGPSLASGPWTPEQLWETGYIDAFKDSLAAITVEQ